MVLLGLQVMLEFFVKLSLNTRNISENTANEHVGGLITMHWQWTYAWKTEVSIYETTTMKISPCLRYPTLTTSAVMAAQRCVRSHCTCGCKVLA